jgi:hypothetical protein
MPTIDVALNQTVTLNRGDVVKFAVPTQGSQYHFAVAGGNPCIAVWAGLPWNHNGLANNIDYATHSLKGPFVDKVLNTPTAYVSFEDDAVKSECPGAHVADEFTLTVTKNSWWKKVFGW